MARNKYDNFSNDELAKYARDHFEGVTVAVGAKQVTVKQPGPGLKANGVIDFLVAQRGFVRKTADA